MSSEANSKLSREYLCAREASKQVVCIRVAHDNDNDICPLRYLYDDVGLIVTEPML